MKTNMAGHRSSPAVCHHFQPLHVCSLTVNFWKMVNVRRRKPNKKTNKPAFMLLIATWTHGTHSSSSAKTCPPADMKHGDYLSGCCHTSWAFKVTATSRDNDPFWGAFSWQIHWRSRRLPLYPGAAAQCCHFDMAAAPRENVLLISFHFNRGLFKLTENWNKDGMDKVLMTWIIPGHNYSGEISTLS